jgi:hypothetical protein
MNNLHTLFWAAGDLLDLAGVFTRAFFGMEGDDLGDGLGDDIGDNNVGELLIVFLTHTVGLKITTKQDQWQPTCQLSGDKEGTQ